MLTNGDKISDFDPVFSPFVRYWTEYADQVNNAAREIFSGFDDGSQLKSWQRKWMDALSQSMDAYMRTPAFLQAMKHHTDTAIKLKQKSDDLTSELARTANIPTASDISGLFERLKCIEDTILKRLEHMDKRLEFIEVGAGREVSPRQ